MKRLPFGLMVATMMLVVLPVLLLDQLHLLALAGLWMALWAVWFYGMPRYRAHLLALACLLPVLGWVSECAFRFHIFGVQGLSFDRYRPAGYAHPWSHFEYDPATYTGLKPDHTVFWKGHWCRINHHGFRGRDYAYAKPEQTYRFLVLGASVPMGSGVRDDEVLFQLLEERLKREGGGPAVDIVNLSQGGSNMGEMIHTLAQAGMDYNPDHILFFFDPFTVSDDPYREVARGVRRMEVPVWRKVVEPRFSFFNNRFFIARALRQQNRVVGRFALELVAPRHPLIYTTTEMRAERMAYLDTALARLREVAGDRKVSLFVLRDSAHVWGGIVDGPVQDALEALAAPHDHEVLWVSGEIFSDYAMAELTIYPGDAHPNAMAHAMYADALFPMLLEHVSRESGRATDAAER